VTPEIASESLISLFSELVLVPGTSRDEQRVAAWVRQRLAGLPFDISEDASGAAIGGNTGNLIIKPRHFDPTRPVQVYFAHMDTVRNTSGIQVVRRDGRLTSDGSCQIGADNRAGMATLLHTLEHHAEWERLGVNYMVVFTIAEEIGLLGATHIDLSAYNVEAAYVFDSSRRPGTYIRDCAGMYQFEVQVHGRAAHSAVNPEEGISAIMVAAKAIAQIEIGKIADMTTVNIGKISGGEATNVVTPLCKVIGEVRSTTTERIMEYLRGIQQIFENVAAQHGARITMTWHKEFPPYVHGADAPIVRNIEAALHSAGLTPDPLRYTGGSDANVLNEKGLASVNIGIGAQKPHADDEFILEEDLIAAARIAAALMRQHAEVR
jgi:tripeptide aminopeptidase